MKILPLFLSTLVVGFINSGCQTTSQGIGGNTKLTNNSDIVAYDINYHAAVELAMQACQSVFDEVSINESDGIIKVYHDSGIGGGGTAGGTITPQMVVSANDENLRGVIFKVDSYGTGYNSSFIPGFIAKMFFGALSNTSYRSGINQVTIRNYKYTDELSKSDSVAGILPTSLDGFKKYIDEKIRKYDFEGVWQSSDGNYTLGIYYDEMEPMHKYKAFVIDSKWEIWREGEIKVKWTDLSNDNVSMGDWYMRNKLKVSSVFKAQNNIIMPMGGSLTESSGTSLIKLYPSTNSKNTQSTGTGFAISPNGIIVTAYHVVKNSDDIEVLIPGLGFKPAEISSSNPSNDIAILKVKSETKNFLQISNFKSSKISDKVYTMGYPLSSVLGDKPKYSEGVINALTGLGDSASLMQVSIPIQPGNSGGPVLNDINEVVGMVVSTAGIEAFYALSGTIPQNVNWAVKSDYIRLVAEIDETKRIENNSLDEVIKSICFVRVN